MNLSELVVRGDFCPAGGCRLVWSKTLDGHRSSGVRGRRDVFEYNGIGVF